MRLTFRAWFAIVALCGLLFMLSGPMPVGSAQPLPTEEADDPVEIGTLPPRIERPIRLTPTPTTPPRERPTMVPTEELVVPTESPETPTPPPETAALEAQVQTGTITLHKHACPREDGLALDDANDDGPLDPYAGGDQSAFLSKCPVVDAPVEFTITGGDGIGQIVATDLNGFGEFNVPTGAISVTETLPQGTTTPAIHCESNLVVPPIGTPLEFSETATWTLQPGEELHCWFFNLSGESSLNVLKFTCPEGVSPLSDQFSPFSVCLESMTGVEFTVSDANGSTSQAMPGESHYVWKGLVKRQDGTIEISESLPEGYGEPAWYCGYPERVDIGETFGMHVPSQDGTITLSFPNPGQPVYATCWVFNAPPEGTSGHDLTIGKYTCPEGYDDTGVPLQTLREDCTGHPGPVEFQVSNQGGLIESKTLPGGDVPIVSFDNLPAGIIQVHEVVPPGYLAMSIWCTDDSTDQTVDTFENLPIQKQSNILLNFDDSTSVSCVWFNIESSVPTGDNTVIVHKWECPDDLVPVDGKPVNSWLQTCTVPMDIVTFTLDGPAGAIEGSTAGGTVTWVNQPLGDFTITESIPAGYGEPVVYCSIMIPNSGGPMVEVPSPNGIASFSFQVEGSSYTCEWFNIHASDEPPSGNTVTVNKWRCNVEDTGSAPDWPLEDLLATCDEVQDGVEFTLTNPDGASTQTTANGIAQWTDLSPGAFSIQETIPEYYDEPVVFCSIAIPNGGGPMVKVPSTDGKVEASLGVEGSHYTCHWFNIDFGPHSIRIWKNICPDDILTGQPLDYYEAECNIPQPNVPFAATTVNGLVSGDTNFAGVLVLNPIPVGNVTIQETIPTGYGDPIVFCQTSATYGGQTTTDPFSLQVTSGGTLNTSMPKGGHVDCWWFNVTTDPASVVLHKWTCPDGTGYAETNDWYVQNCTEALDGVGFTLSTGGGNTVGVTAGGTVIFDDVIPGPIGIQETIPAGYGAPIVLCDVDGTLFGFPSPTGHLARDLAPGATLVCHWFNIPADSGDITVVKHACPANYDFANQGSDPEADCPQMVDGVEFVLDGPAVATVVTGNTMPGIAYFGDLPPGSYTITETVPEGTASIFVMYCTGHIMGTLQPVPLSQDESLVIDVDAGERLTCHWYNVPESDGGTVTVIKYTCTTATYVSDIDCQIEEGGVTFDLLDADGNVVATGTTDGFGRLTWTNLTPGDHALAEHDANWCRMLATPSEGGATFGVNGGQATVIEVYNCGEEPGVPGDTPTKYPDTGAEPIAGVLPVAGMLSTSPEATDSFFSRFAIGRAERQRPLASHLPFLPGGMWIRDQVVRGRQNRVSPGEWGIGPRCGHRACQESDSSTDRACRRAQMDSEDINPFRRPAWISDPDQCRGSPPQW